MSDVFENAAPRSAGYARRQRALVLALMVGSLGTGIAIGSAVTRGALADPDNRISLSSGAVTADSLATSFASAASSVETSVVSIDTQEGDDADLARSGKGSGVIVTSTGYILTNHHVVEGATSIRVRLSNRKEFDARVIGQDRETDLAVLKIEPGAALPFAKFGDSDRLRVGDWVLAIGSPFGLEQTVTHGIISARERETGVGSSAFQRFLQTDAPINPGNSGGPLVNLAGEVIGINTQIATRTGSFSGIGLALPSRTAVEIYNQIVTNGRVGRGFLGIRVGEVTTEIAKRNGLEGTDGVLVADLSGTDSPAGKAGIQSGDVITEINGERVKDGRDLIRRIGAMPVGSVARLTYVREGQPGSATVKLTDRESGLETSRNNDIITAPLPGFDDEEVTPGRPTPSPAPGLGMTLRTLTPDLARDRNLEGVTGVLVLDVAPRSVAARAGITVGYVIVSVDGRKVASENELEEALAEAGSGETVVLGVAHRVGSRVDRRFVRVVVP